MLKCRHRVECGGEKHRFAKKENSLYLFGPLAVVARGNLMIFVQSQVVRRDSEWRRERLEQSTMYQNHVFRLRKVRTDGEYRWRKRS